MAYTKTNWINGSTPINETNLNKIETELKYLDDEGLLYLGLVPVDDLNDLANMKHGYYQTGNKTLANAGDEYNWCSFFNIKVGTGTRQILMKNAFIKTRVHSGNPLQWSSWETYSSNESKNVITVSITDQTMTSSDMTEIAVNGVLGQSGTKLSVSDGGIKVGGKFSRAIISGQLYINPSAAGVKQFAFGGAIGRIDIPSKYNTVIPLTPRVVPITEGQILKAKFQGANGDKVNSSTTATFLTIEVIK